jgi:hypothetical protein
MLCDMLVRAAVTAWLVAVGCQDLRQREVSNWLTLPPLLGLACFHLGSAVVRLVSSRTWSPTVADGIAVAAAFLAVVLSDRWWTFVPPAAGALALAGLAGTSAGQLVVVAWLLALALSKAGIVGEADGKLVMALLALFPDLPLALCLLAASLLASLAVLARRVGAATPVLLRAVVKDGLAGRFPARTGAAGVALIPLTPVLGLGAVVYLWPLWLMGVAG